MIKLSASMLLSIALLLITAPLAAQEAYKKYTELSYAEIDSLVMIPFGEGDYSACLDFMKAGQEKAKAEFGTQDSAFAKYTADIGFFYRMMGQYSLAEAYHLEALGVFKNTIGEMGNGYVACLNNLANLYQDLGDYTSAEPLYIKVIEIWKKILGEEDPDYFAALNNLAVLYDDMGYYSKAEPLYLQILNFKKKTLGEADPKYALSLNNLGLLYRTLGEYKKAEPLFLEAKNIFSNSLGEEHPYFSICLNNLALLYKALGKFDQTEILILQAIRIDKKRLGAAHPEYANSLSNLADLYQAMTNYSKALSLQQQVLKIRTAAFGSKHPYCAESFIKFAKLHLLSENPDSALHFSKLSLSANSSSVSAGQIDWADLDKHTYYSTLRTNNSITTILDILDYQFRKTNDKKYLEQAYILAQAAIRLNAKVRSDFSEESDKLRTLSIANTYLNKGIYAGERLEKDPAKLFGFAESNKGILILEASQTAFAKNFGNVPDSLLLQEQTLQKEKTRLQALLLEPRPQTEKDSLLYISTGLNQKIEAFNNKVKSTYPAYIKLKYESQISSAEEVQATLDEKTALLEYVWNDSMVYIFYLDKQRIKLEAVFVENALLKDNIKLLHNTLSNYEYITHFPDDSRRDFIASASWLCKKLIPNILFENKNIKQLLIIPDAELAHLPFETFLLEVPEESQSYPKFKYLINDFAISYHYSATLWLSDKHTTRQPNNGEFIAMAASYKSSKAPKNMPNTRSGIYRNLRDVLQDLPAAREEVKMLSKSFSGVFLFDSLASERNFKEKAKNFQIIHLAMHGLLDDKNPILSSLAFSEDGDSSENNFLQAYEISKMELRADLVVLSACQTGYGRFETGNGTASLSRAFMYAGVPALVVSLWQVNDESTSAIMQLFYKNLAKGMDKAEALQQAKLAYVETIHESSQQESIAAHPAFWSPFILIGNTAPIKIAQKSGGWWFWGAIGGGLFLLVGIGMSMRSRRK